MREQADGCLEACKQNVGDNTDHAGTDDQLFPIRYGGGQLFRLGGVFGFALCVFHDRVSFPFFVFSIVQETGAVLQAGNRTCCM